MIPLISGSCETAGEHANASDSDPSLGAGDCLLEVLGETSASSEPGQGSFDHPTSWLGFEGSDALAAGDDLNRPFAELGDGVKQFGASVDTIGEEMPQGRKRKADGFQQ